MAKSRFYYFDQLTKQEKEELIKTILPTAGEKGTIIKISSVSLEEENDYRQIIVKKENNSVPEVSLGLTSDFLISGADYRVCDRTAQVITNKDFQRAYVKFMITKFGAKFASAYVKAITKIIIEKTDLAVESIMKINRSLYGTPIEEFDDGKHAVAAQTYQETSIEELKKLVSNILDEVRAEKSAGAGV